MAELDHLFGFDGDEYLQNDLDTVVEQWLDDHDPIQEGDDAEFEVLEWSAVSAGTYLPSAVRVLEWMEEYAADELLFEEAGDALLTASRKPEVVAAAEHMRKLFVDAVGDRWRMADKVVARYHFTFDADRRLLCNGTPYEPEGDA